MGHLRQTGARLVIAFLLLAGWTTVPEASGNCDLQLLSKIPGQVVGVRGQLAYIVNDTNFAVWDVTNPALPVKKGETRLVQPVTHLCVEGNFVYAGDEGAINIVDVTDIAHPSMAGLYVFDSPCEYRLRDIAAIGNALYVSQFCEGVRIIDTSDPAIPVLVRIIPNPQPFDAIEHIETNANSLFLGSYQGSIDIYDASVATNPQKISGVGSARFLTAMKYSQGYLYTASYTSSTMEIADVRDVLDPVNLGGYVHGPGNIDILGVDGDVAYFSYDGSVQRLKGVDPYKLRSLGTYSVPTTSFLSAAAANGVLYYFDGIQISISRLAAPPFILQPVNRRVKYRHNMAFVARIPVGFPASSVEFQWMKDGADIANGTTEHGSRITGANTVQINLFDVRPGDAGAYQLRATIVEVSGWGCLGENVTDTAVLTVGCAADFDGDGVVNGDDFDKFVVAFVGAQKVADFDRNGFVNGDDFDGYVAAFEVGC